MPTDYFCIGKSDICDSKTVDYFCKCCFFCLLNAVHQVFIGLFSKAFHRLNFFLIEIQMEDISVFVNESSRNKFLQCRLRKTVNIECIPADKQCKGFDSFCLTHRICAIQRLCIIHLTDLRSSTTNRTDFRNLNIITAGQILCNLRNDHIRFIDFDRIPDSQMQLLHNT